MRLTRGSPRVFFCLAGRVGVWVAWVGLLGCPAGFCSSWDGTYPGGTWAFSGRCIGLLVRRKVSGERIGTREPGYRQKGPLGQGPFCKKVWEKRLLGANGRFSRANLLFEGGNGRGREAEDIF